MWDFEDAIHRKASDWIPPNWQRGIDYPGPLDTCLNILYYRAEAFGMRDRPNKLCGSCGTNLRKAHQQTLMQLHRLGRSVQTTIAP